MAATAPHTVLVSTNGAERPILNDRVATASTVPGCIVEVASTGKLTKISSAAKQNNRIFVVENPYATDHTASALSQAYAADDAVFYVYAQPGDIVYALLAASQTISIGSPLVTTTTAGALGTATIDATVVTGALVGFAEEAVTTTGSTGYVKVRIA